MRRGGQPVTSEDDFQAKLDAEPDNHTARLVFADWLEEHGDPRAEGWRALGARQRKPMHQPEGYPAAEIENAPPGSWEWWEEESKDYPEALPRDWLDEIDTKFTYRSNDGRVISQDFRTRREAEDAAAIAFSRLPPE